MRHATNQVEERRMDFRRIQLNARAQRIREKIKGKNKMKKINKILSFFGLVLIKKDTAMEIRDAIGQWASWFNDDTYELEELFDPTDGEWMKDLSKQIKETID